LIVINGESGIISLHFFSKLNLKHYYANYEITFFSYSLFFVFLVAVIAQITGKVIDAKTKESIIGASVKIANTSIGAITDINGIFRISTSLKNAEIEVSYIGYTTKKKFMEC